MSLFYGILIIPPESRFPHKCLDKFLTGGVVTISTSTLTFYSYYSSPLATTITHPMLISLSPRLATVNIKPSPFPHKSYTSSLTIPACIALHYTSLICYANSCHYGIQTASRFNSPAGCSKNFKLNTPLITYQQLFSHFYLPFSSLHAKPHSLLPYPSLFIGLQQPDIC